MENDRSNTVAMADCPSTIKDIIDVLDSGDGKQFFFNFWFNSGEVIDTGEKKINGRLSNVPFMCVCNGFVITKYNEEIKVFKHADIDHIRILNEPFKFPTSDSANNQG